MSGMPDWLRKLSGAKGLKVLILIVTLAVAASLLLMDGTLFAPISQPQGNDIEKRLASILSSIDGAGKVSVMVYESSVAASSGWLNETKQSSGGPVGVVVVAEGAGNLRVQFELVRAVQTLLGLPSSAIDVFQRAPE